VRGLLDGLTAIPAIMKKYACTYDEAETIWKLELEVELLEQPPSAEIIPFPIERVRR
jgi:hypothetical protein